MIQCPRCFSNNVKPIGTTHYVCSNKDCIDSNGRRTQFKIINDNKINFPYNIIYEEYNPSDRFYRYEYLTLKNIGDNSI